MIPAEMNHERYLKGIPMHYRARFLFSVICIFVFPVVFYFSYPSFAEEKLSDRVYEKTLTNGLKVILLENRKAPVVTVQVWYRVGSRNEAWGKTGLSHFLEHMMFKGSKRFSAEEFVRIIEENGGNNNAFTSRDYTAYYVNISADRAAIPLELDADRMTYALFDEKDFLTERDVVLEERRLRTEDNPQSFLYEQVFATAFQVHPYHWPIIGWMEDIGRITLADVKEYYERFYAPANAFIVVVGDFSRDELLPEIEKTFGSLIKKPAPNQEVSREPVQHGERRAVVNREGLVPALMIGYHVPNLKNQDSYVLEVIEAILSLGKSSRLYEQIVRDKQLALTINAHNPLLSRDPSLFFVSAELMSGKDLSALEKAIDEEILRLHNEPVSYLELEKARNQLEAAFIYGQDSVFYRAMVLARYEIADNWRTADDYLPAIRKVTQDDILRVARRYLVPANRTLGTFMPVPSKKAKQANPQPPVNEPELNS